MLHLLLLWPASSCPLPTDLPAKQETPPLKATASTQAGIEADWLLQARVRGPAMDSKEGPVTCEEDAAGGCDGVTTGRWGFHTRRENDPWWQVDLGSVRTLDRIVLYNRCDGGFASRASRIQVLLSREGKEFTRAYQHDGTIFLGATDGKPLEVSLEGQSARIVRIQAPGLTFFHLDEVKIYAEAEAGNIALGRPATQSSTCRWSSRHQGRTSYGTHQVIRRGLALADDLGAAGATRDRKTLERIARQVRSLPADAPDEARRKLYIEARRAIRTMVLANPLLDFESILFVKRAPGTLPHMSDQYYGWWSRPGGGLYILEGFKGSHPRLRCLTPDWPEGSYLRPDLSFDGKRVLFAYCRHHPHVAAMEKVDKEKLPEDAFYHIFEMHLDGTSTRQLTRGRYDDFDARYLPGGQIVFLSTRKGQFIQCGKASAGATCDGTLPDSYVRCGGDTRRPCAVYTLFLMDSQGQDLRAASAFENFEWTPSVAWDGRILYARWDYIDRPNDHFQSLWSATQDGANPQLVYGNFTVRPQCIFEARSIPGSHKLVFTASAHHSITGGSLVLLDPRQGTEGARPLTRLTPEVRFPEIEGWSDSYYANPFPLSEQYYLVAWSGHRLPPHRGSRQVQGHENPVNALGLYLYDRFGNLEPIYRDPDISSMYPIPVRARRRPMVQAGLTDWDAPQEGCFLVQDVYQGLKGIRRGSIDRLRIVGVVPKTQPQQNTPILGVSRQDPGKFVLGTIPVEEDGSAFFRVPSGVPLFFQALDQDGLAVQTMRTLTYVQPSQTLSCIGCHESRGSAPTPTLRPLAAMRAPSRIRPGPPGSWPLRFDRLVQPVLNRSCISCHSPESEDREAARLDLTAAGSYGSLIAFADKNLEKLAFERDRSVAGEGVARQSLLFRMLAGAEGHEGVRLDRESLSRLAAWMDLYAHRQGSFSPDQEERLLELREKWDSLITPE